MELTALEQGRGLLVMQFYLIIGVNFWTIND